MTKKANKFNEGKETMINMEAIRCCTIKSTRSFKILRFKEILRFIERCQNDLCAGIKLVWDGTDGDLVQKSQSDKEFNQEINFL